MDYGLEKHCSRERTQQTTGKHDYGTEFLRKTTMTDDNLRPPVVRLAPMFYESVFREIKQPLQWVLCARCMNIWKGSAFDSRGSSSFTWQRKVDKGVWIKEWINFDPISIIDFSHSSHKVLKCEN